MLNHKKILFPCVAAVILLCGCGNKNADIINKNLVKSEEGFGMDKAAKGELKETKSFSASVVYPLSTIVYSPYNGLVMEKIEVEYGDKVKKGDLLVSIRPVTSETIAEQQTAIDKNLQELNKGIENYNSQIASLDQMISSTSGTQQQIHQVQKEKTLRQLEYYKQDGEKVQQNMKKELEVLKTLEGDMNIYAPYDGVVDKVENIVAGTELTTTREIVSIHSEAETLLYVSEGSSLKYNMPVTVKAGTGEAQKEYKGTVVSADNVLDDAYQSHGAYIKLEEKVNPDSLKSVTVIADVKNLKNVLLVKEFAVTTQNNQKYISIVDGDKVKKRPVVTGAGDGENVWILKGIEEGQQVLIQ